ARRSRGRERRLRGWRTSWLWLPGWHAVCLTGRHPMKTLRSRLVLACVLSLGLGACAAGMSGNAALYEQAAHSDPRGQPSVIGVGDVGRISVWRDETLSTEAIVRPDGTITMPVVGELRAAGRTTNQLQQDVAQRLTSFVKEAVVTVSVTEV